METINRIVDLDRYPLHRLDTDAGKKFVDGCKTQLDQTGCCLLPSFLLPGAVATAREDAVTIAPKAYQVNHGFAYDDVNDNSLMEPVDTLPPGHPRRFKSLTKIRFVAKDLISDSNPVRPLHNWQGMTDFIGQVMDMSPVYPSACPLSGCILTVAEKDELQDWHFDGNEFIVTLMLEDSREGGKFEYVTGLRDPQSGDDFDQITRILKGERKAVIAPPIVPGTLTLFKGKYNLHRAAPVGENSRRIMAVLSYENSPDRKGTNEYLKLFYGRSLEEAN